MSNPVKLTEKEQQIINELLKGKTRKSITGIFNISINTLNSHMRNLHLKTSTHSIPDLILWAIKNHASVNSN